MDEGWASSLDYKTEETSPNRKYIFMPNSWITEAQNIKAYMERIANYARNPPTTGATDSNGEYLIHVSENLEHFFNDK